MTIEQLTDEQIRTWTREEKDRWWLERVYRGSMPQLTLRAALMGFLLGGVLSATNLYIGAKTGWSLGVGITSVIMAFAFFRVMQRLGAAREFSILENNCVQSIATSAGYMTSPLISSLVAYMLVRGELLPWWQMLTWNIAVSVLGVLFAFPLKRRFINDEQHPFPEGKACGVVLDALHTADAALGVVKARVLLITALGAAFIKFLQAHAIQEWIQHKLLKLESAVVTFPEALGDGIAWLFVKAGLRAPAIGGIDIRQLTINPTLELALIGAGGLMGIRAGMSLLIGGLINYAVLAPVMINMDVIQPARVTEAGAVYGFRPITTWALWPGVACMVLASFTALFAKPQAFVKAFAVLGGKKQAGSDVLGHIELPLWVSFVGVPVVGVIAAFLAQAYFGVDPWLCLLGLPLAFVLALVAASSTALTGTTPVGATSKVTQLFYGVAAPGNTTTNLATASLTAEVVSNASNLLMDIKPGYMLGAKPRQQAIGHLIGILAGSIASVPLFFLLFTQGVDKTSAETVRETIPALQSTEFPMPSATVWRAVAEALTQGLGGLHPTVVYAVIVGALVGLTLEVGRIVTKGRFPLSPIALGLAFVINFESIFAMSLGAIIFWFLGVGRSSKRGPEMPKTLWVENHEPICAGVIAGAALMGIADAVVATFVL